MTPDEATRFHILRADRAEAALAAEKAKTRQLEAENRMLRASYAALYDDVTEEHDIRVAVGLAGVAVPGIGRVVAANDGGV